MTSKGSDQTARISRLIWGFAGRTYHIVGNLMHWLKFNVFFGFCLIDIIEVAKTGFTVHEFSDCVNTVMFLNMPRNITCICPGTLQTNVTSLAYGIHLIASLHIHTHVQSLQSLRLHCWMDGTEKWTSRPTGNPVIEGHEWVLFEEKNI